jgi:hypothetical protein
VVYDHRVGIDRTAGQVFSAEFVPLAESGLAESQPKRVEHSGIPIVLIGAPDSLEDGRVLYARTTGRLKCASGRTNHNL